MENHELNIKTIKFWTELPVKDKVELLEKNNFWGGFDNYKFEYLPEDLKDILRLKIEENDLK